MFQKKQKNKINKNRTKSHKNHQSKKGKNSLHIHCDARRGVNTRPDQHLCHNGINVYVPKMTRQHGKKEFIMSTSHFQKWEDMVENKWGILESKKQQKTTKNIDAIIVPAVAVSSTGERLGRGGGHYDRFLAQNKKATRIAVAYACQIRTVLPQE
ncbi:MAG: 5-formyltetrahydrofolate cyclo-ligase [Candidatus Moranbacteria bacterium]|nr:5-formyltetrahydrofolate cyclo-ligase [Candidatus Moranbacteria bacterium]